MVNNDLTNDKQKIKDFEILKEIVNGNINIKDLDTPLKMRLIGICNNRLNQINEKIKYEKSKRKVTQ